MTKEKLKQKNFFIIVLFLYMNLERNDRTGRKPEDGHLRTQAGSAKKKHPSPRTNLKEL